MLFLTAAIILSHDQLFIIDRPLSITAQRLSIIGHADQYSFIIRHLLHVMVYIGNYTMEAGMPVVRHVLALTVAIGSLKVPRVHTGIRRSSRLCHTCSAARGTGFQTGIASGPDI